eukprot:357911_1
MKFIAIFVTLCLLINASISTANRADLYFQCDNYVSKIVYSYCGQTLNWSYKQVPWTEEVHVILPAFQGGSVNVFCENIGNADNGGNPGGFLATVKYNGHQWSTTKNNGRSDPKGPWFMWRVRNAGDKWTENWTSQKEAIKGQGIWGGRVGSNIDPSASWVWKGNNQAVQMNFRFGNVEAYFGITPPDCSQSAHALVNGNNELNDNDINDFNNGHFMELSSSTIYVIGLFIILFVFLLGMNVACLWRYNWCSKKNMYRPVKYVDSEFDSEAHAFKK